VFHETFKCPRRVRYYNTQVVKRMLHEKRRTKTRYIIFNTRTQSKNSPIRDVCATIRTFYLSFIFYALYRTTETNDVKRFTKRLEFSSMTYGQHHTPPPTRLKIKTIVLFSSSLRDSYVLITDRDEIARTVYDVLKPRKITIP